MLAGSSGSPVSAPLAQAFWQREVQRMGNSIERERGREGKREGWEGGKERRNERGRE